MKLAAGLWTIQPAVDFGCQQQALSVREVFEMGTTGFRIWKI